MALQDANRPASRPKRESQDCRSAADCLLHMRLVPTSRVQDGTLLARDVLVGRSDGIPLLRAGVRLNGSYRQGLERAGIYAVYIEDALSEGINVEPLLNDQTRSLATRAVADAYADAKQSVASGRPMASGTIESLTDIVAQILDEVGP